ncbi:MAG: amidohydrolase [Bacteroidales bacterium]|nr:amidohydrolase [Bacteroidales bacterium]
MFIRQIQLVGFLFIFMGFGAYGQNPDSLLLKDYDPKSVYNIPETHITRAAYTVIDVHSHDYATTEEEIDQWVRTMDSAGIEKSIILSTATGAEFDSIVEKYSAYPDRFEIWCGIDYSGYKTDNWPAGAIEELERCHAMGAEGVGELGDKGLGLFYCDPPAYGMHLDDERMKPILRKCAEFDMPVNIHVADPYWMYLPMDAKNDGLMNAWEWKIDTTKENILLHHELIQTLENAVRENPNTTFIACHFANCSHDLKILGGLLKRYPNLYADISARYAETATIPRFTQTFYRKYQDRLVYGTDMGRGRGMYETTFRILESADEHFYPDRFSYHWPLYGLDLPRHVLRKVYRSNAIKVLDLD